jgi:hypothetical protein
MTLTTLLNEAKLNDLKRVLNSDKEYLYIDVSVFNTGMVVRLRLSNNYKPINRRTHNGYDCVFVNDETTKYYIEETIKSKEKEYKF